MKRFMKTVRNTKWRTETARTFRESGESDLSGLCDDLLRERLASTASATLKMHYKWAADEAAALAFMTPWPTLFFPVLFAEKADAAEERVVRQARIRPQPVSH